MLLILAIAAIIGLFISVSKSIRFLRQEDTKSSKKWAWIAVAIVLVYGLVVFLFNKLFPESSTKPTLGNIGLGKSKYKLKENEVRKSGKPYSNFDVINNTLIYKSLNLRKFRISESVIAYLTSDPDYNADGKIMMGFARQEISFSDDILLTEDKGFIDTKGLKEFPFKKGVIYKVSISAPADSPIGYTIEVGNNEYFYLSSVKGGKLSYEHLLI